MDLRSYAPLDVDHARIDIFESMAAVARDGGKSRLRQAIEMFGLVAGHARLSPADYYRYQLYDDAQHCRADKKTFVGNNRYWTTTLRVSDSRWCALTDDKLVTAALLGSNGVAVPEIQAVYHRYRGFPGAAALNTPDALREFLTRTAAYPLFGKPVSGFESKGAVYLEGFDADSGELLLYNGERVPVDTFAHAVEQFVYDPPPGFRRFRSQLGYMFQGVIRQHPQLVEAAGPTVASVRPFVIIGEGGPRIVAMTWKVPAPGNFSDNTLHPGNMLANVDIETGTVTRVVRGAGVALEVLEHNPATGQRLVGFRLPHFEKLKTVVLEGAALIPGIRIQGWDVALGPDGPIVVEVNNGSGYTAPQLASGRGFLTPEFERFLELAETENETWPWREFFRRQEHGHRFGRVKGVLNVVRQAILPTPR
jgi:hypothetical protein